ncbi:hypothetical protein AB0C69_28200 [Actinomadura sp. NPDC048032]|uniref:hypothetical protein n=1 Tax=Actinomadura TaxID=1988 RepID=UPI0031EB10D0
MKRRILTAVALVGIGATVTALTAAPAQATPSPSCWAALTADGRGIGSCQGNPSGGSWYRVQGLCALPFPNPPGSFVVSSQPTYASPNQPGIVVMTPPCGSLTFRVTNAWATSW